MLAPTVVIQGTEPGPPTVPAPGPLFPADVATNTPVKVLAGMAGRITVGSGARFSVSGNGTVLTSNNFD